MFRGENAFALGVVKTNPTAKIHNRWTLTWFDLNLEKQAAESLLEPPVRAELLAQHQDSPAASWPRRTAGKFGIAYDADMNDDAPKATSLRQSGTGRSTTSRPSKRCAPAPGARRQGTIPQEYRNWMGSIQGRHGRGGAAQHGGAGQPPAQGPDPEALRRRSGEFKSGAEEIETIFTGPDQGQHRRK